MTVTREGKIAHAFKSFANHKAVLKDLGGIQILNWQIPGEIWYKVRYVFDLDGKRIYISGDLGAAVVHPTWPATFEHTYHTVCGARPDVNEGYFLEKVEATSNRYEYDRDEAEKMVKERCEGIEEEEDALERVMESFDDRWGLIHASDLARQILGDYDEDYWAWISRAGQSIDGRIYLWLVGLKMAWQQIHVEAK